MLCWIEKPTPTLDNLQEVKIEKWERSNRMCLMISQNKKKKNNKGDAKGSFFETENMRFLEEVEFENEENTRNVIFDEESANDIVIEDNVQTIVPDIVPKQDYDEVLHQTPIKQPQQPKEVSLRRSIKERRHVIPYDYIIFLQERENNIGLTKDDPIKFCQAM
ncbi:hypothetical protein CR513_00165, partial [Mucuna pruriens]